MKESTSDLLAAFFLAVLVIILSLSVGIFVNQYTINSYIFPLFNVDRVFGYWQTFFFTGIWNLLLFSSYTSYKQKYETSLEQMASSFCTCLGVYAMQALLTWAGIQVTF